MNAKDVKKLWTLLAELYPRQPQAATAERLGAWAQALEPFEYEAIKQAALAHARKSDYYPSVSEIVSNLPRSDKNAWMDEFLDKRTGSGQMRQRYVEAHGLETDDSCGVSRYAREQGMTRAEAAAAMGKEKTT